MNSRIKIIQRLYQLRAMSTKFTVPEAGEMEALKIHVSNLPWTVSQRELGTYFSQFGPIAEAKVIFNKETGFSRGFGFVTFIMSKSYIKAIRTKEHVLEGSVLEINQIKHLKTQSKEHDIEI